jgi:hypothetical protein
MSKTSIIEKTEVAEPTSKVSIQSGKRGTRSGKLSAEEKGATPPASVNTTVTEESPAEATVHQEACTSSKKRKLTQMTGFEEDAFCSDAPSKKKLKMNTGEALPSPVRLRTLESQEEPQLTAPVQAVLAEQVCSSQAANVGTGSAEEPVQAEQAHETVEAQPLDMPLEAPVEHLETAAIETASAETAPLETASVETPALETAPLEAVEPLACALEAVTLEEPHQLDCAPPAPSEPCVEQGETGQSQVACTEDQ